MRRLVGALGASLAMASCSPASQGSGSDKGAGNPVSPKIVEIVTEIPDWVRHLPRYDVAEATRRAFGVERVYVDGEDVGTFELGGSTSISVPGDGRTFQLKEVTNAVTRSTAATTHIVDISGFAPGSRIFMRCVLHPGGVGTCTASPIGD